MKLDYVFGVLKDSGKTRQQLLDEQIAYKLKKSEADYKYALERTAEYVLSRDSIKVIRAMEAERRREERLIAKEEAKNARKRATKPNKRPVSSDDDS